MSYMRTPIYAWVGRGCDCDVDCDDSAHLRIHLWARTDTDGVRDSVRYYTDGSPYHPGFVSGVAMPLSVFDELVMMRWAELVRDGLVDDTIERIEADDLPWGNYGTHTLAHLLGVDPVSTLPSTRLHSQSDGRTDTD